MRKTIPALLILAMLMAPVCLATDADTYPNEAITELRAVFHGTADNITLTVYVKVNDAAKAQGDLEIDVYIDNINVYSALATAFEDGEDIPWDSTEYGSGWHTLKVQFSNPNEDISCNQADNELSLLISTPDYWLATLINSYGFLEYSIYKSLKHTVNGYFAFFTVIPLWAWFIVLLIIIGLIVILKKRKKEKRSIPVPYWLKTNK
ncbi:MAG: hypothetical protein DRN66_03485 [Candidatus Nanohalarchaeota archaeon]|nr:MAG: hypothetical protein DRN66_03485 [Candidatus Nanohaloarchaeota archaeon]